MAIVGSFRCRAAEADTIVEDHTTVAMLASLIAIPLAEFAALSAVHVKMVEQLARLYKVDFKAHLAKTFIASLLTSYVSTVAGTFAAGRLAKLVPGLSGIVGVVTLAPLAGALTYGLGQAFIWHFESGGTLSALDEPNTQAALRREMKQSTTGWKTWCKPSRST